MARGGSGGGHLARTSVTERTFTHDQTPGPHEGRRLKEKAKVERGRGFVMEKDSPKVSGSKCHPPWTWPWSGTSSV
ncbi:hypothetical protein LDENG_00210240 [Lucifuga dentata]|nr:hypothetical protein LDENG_00210240 [Lucifuga dentata]